VPTPFQHLEYADRVLEHPALPPALRAALHAEPGAFLLGNTAADVQTITGHRRQATHFYTLADLGVPVAVPRLLRAHPRLAAPADLAPAHAAFVSGYLVHLIWDEIWAWDIFVPFYRDGPTWSDRRSFFLHHNALRVFLDRASYATLRARPAVRRLLSDVRPAAWLPFAPDPALCRWRDWLVEQLADPSLVQTVQVFADRMRVPVAEVTAVVRDLTSGSYTAVPGLTAALRRYEQDALWRSLGALLCYWGFKDKLLTEFQPESAVLASPEGH
jgi:hypothetical protein